MEMWQGWQGSYYVVMVVMCVMLLVCWISSRNVGYSTTLVVGIQEAHMKEERDERREVVRRKERENK